MAAELPYYFSAKPTKWLLPYWPVCLVLCILSRALTSIHYLADLDSLRFALGIQEFDLARLQPHFPGYPVFCFLVKGLYLAIGKFSYAFALMGGLATFGLLVAGFALFRQLFPKGNAWVYLVLLFLNPMVWTLGNRYMPDLTGAALALICLALYVSAGNGNKHAVWWFFMLAGLLAGVRLSYMPLVLLPAVLVLCRGRLLTALAAGALGVLIWLVPMVLDTGLNALVEVARNHTEGHFTQWGGTVLSEPSHGQRLARTLQFIWAHGLGGYWSDRHWLTALFSVGLLTAGVTGIWHWQALAAGKAVKKLPVSGVLLLSGLVYLVWIYFYQNVVHQSRHVLPLLPLLLLLPAAGFSFALLNRPKMGVALLALFLFCYGWLTGILVWQHRSPTAIYQVKSYLISHVQPGQVVVSLDMINYFLEQQGLPATFASAETDQQAIAKAVRQGKTVWVVGAFPNLPQPGPEPVTTFYHNPYVNSLWPEIGLYRYQP